MRRHCRLILPGVNCPAQRGGKEVAKLLVRRPTVSAYLLVMFVVSWYRWRRWDGR